MLIECNNFIHNKIKMNGEIDHFGVVFCLEEHEHLQDFWQIEVYFKNKSKSVLSIHKVFDLDKVRLAYFAAELNLPILYFDAWKWVITVLKLPPIQMNYKGYGEDKWMMEEWATRKVKVVLQRWCRECYTKEHKYISHGKKSNFSNICICKIVDQKKYIDVTLKFNEVAVASFLSSPIFDARRQFELLRNDDSEPEDSEEKIQKDALKNDKNEVIELLESTDDEAVEIVMRKRRRRRNKKKNTNYKTTGMDSNDNDGENTI